MLGMPLAAARRVTILALLSALLWPAPALTQVPAASEVRKAFAKTELVKGYERYKEGDYQAAIAAFERSYVAEPQPKLILNIGAAYEAWGGHCGDALKSFARYFEICAGCPEASSARARQQTLEERCSVEVTITTTPTGAAIRIDGQERGSSPLTLQIPAGAHAISATAPGLPAIERDFPVEEGKPAKLELILAGPVVTRAAAPSPPAEPAAEPTPAVLTTAESRGDGSAGSTRDLWMWTAMGVGAGGLIAGTVFTLQSQETLDDEKAARAAYEDTPTQENKDEVRGLRDDAAGQYVLLQVAFGVGAAGAAAGIWLFLTRPPSPGGDEPAAFSPALGPGNVGLIGSF